MGGKPKTQPIISEIEILSQNTTTLAKIIAVENMLIFEMGIQIYPKRENFAVQPLNYLQILERKIHDKSVEIVKDDLMRW